MGHVDSVERLADTLESRASFLPMKYLGLPLAVTFKAKKIWDEVLEKILIKKSLRED